MAGERIEFNEEQLGRLADGVDTLVRRRAALFCIRAVDEVDIIGSMNKTNADVSFLDGVARGMRMASDLRDLLLKLPSGEAVDLTGMVEFVANGGVVEDKVDELFPKSGENK
jgi:hypothetical protein